MLVDRWRLLVRRYVSVVLPRGGLGRRRTEIDRSDLQMTLTSAKWLGDGSPQLARDEEPGDREHHERGSPVDRACHEATDDESEGRAGRLADKDV